MMNFMTEEKLHYSIYGKYIVLIWMSLNNVSVYNMLVYSLCSYRVYSGN